MVEMCEVVSRLNTKQPFNSVFNEYTNISSNFTKVLSLTTNTTAEASSKHRVDRDIMRLL